MSRITYYPDPITRHRFTESGIVTHDEAQVFGSINLWDNTPLVDMEAASICSEAKSLIDWHNLHIIKIVSDHLEGTMLKKDFVESIINNCCDEIIFGAAILDIFFFQDSTNTFQSVVVIN